ncbi:3-beta hydroxysteroid dehydrogenase/isomerase [Cystobacter fuscus DSM 2262]|uniref:3-beta hydroxysteroid dehydrogenase/isomerase n=1 Tax=Cystobacter fuscus (strain ATCC 25194 / DSM 2262 / NBRC 100088 / M29) TaxID=1242864 RepID=S9QPC2_CYSF2|nr:SDR family oxidoreductase [Cystobacter fuscus]EPX63139.1 3-beta hydroxysteroid dehydrogenase/isomerase [Cystobacter fuscus DSM 2262]
MRVFVTGATGFVGSAVVQELLAAGHEVLGLARSDAGAASLTAIGAFVQRGSIEELDSLERGAATSDAVIHTAFNHDFSKYKESCEFDRRVIETLGAALAGTTRPLIITSALGVLPKGVLGTEETAPASGVEAHPRAATEEAADAVAARGVRVSVVRLPPSVHGDGDPHFVPTLIKLARRTGLSAYIGDGGNRWSSVHRLDAARLYRLVLEKRPGGGRYHAVADEGIPFRDIATAIGRRLGVPSVGKPRDEAAQHFGGFMNFAALDAPASSARTREQLGWNPKQVGLLADLEQGRYFAA